MPGSFDLLETLRWGPEEGFFLLDRHLDRLEVSARHSGYACSRARIESVLQRAVIGAVAPMRVRLLVGRHGEARVETAPLDPAPGLVRVAFAERPIDPGSPFVFHKTTNREHLTRDRLPDYDDTVLWNPDHEITETTIANIVVEIDGRKVTPSVECGLLPGTLRAELLARGEIEEGRVSMTRLRTAPRFWLINSVRGWYDAVLFPRST
jgi:para-aminobenzoate synthetase/4-amino-4-deoxychorismate lyase